jgi:hypothetical protein
MSLLSLLGCRSNDEKVHLQSLYIGGSHGYHAHSNIDYQAERLDNGRTRVTVMVGNDRDRVFETDGSLMDSLEMLVRQYRMDRYNGHYEPKIEIMDGDSWSLELRFTDGSSTFCGGYMAYPPGKGAEAIGKTEGLLSRWLYQEPAEEVGLVSFSYQLFCEEGDEAYSMQLKDSVCTVSSRPLGVRTAVTSDAADAYLATRLANMIRWCHLGSYTGENLAEEDASRPRWILKAEYANGFKIEKMDYLDREKGDSWRHDVPSISESELRHETEYLFREELQRIEDRSK